MKIFQINAKKFAILFTLCVSMRIIANKRRYAMKRVYAVVIATPENGEAYYNVYVPDFDIYTEGESVENAIFMAKDAIGAAGITLQDIGKPIPEPSSFKPNCGENEFVALVDVDFSAYRQKEDMRMVRKNCTIPAWMNKQAEERSINFSAVLQESL